MIEMKKAIAPEIEKLHNWLKERENDLLRDYRKMLQIPSIQSDPLPDAPFGAENRKALDYALELSKQFGMKTTDLEGFIGFGEFGTGTPLILSLGHLDVVPTGPGWKHPEFGAEIDNGYVYSRGAVDDKGPTMASLYALRAIKECFPDLKVRFRQVFGCNEESGFNCVHRYTKTEELPTFGVAPDSGWPLCNAEKGIGDLIVSIPLLTGSFALKELSGGQRPNIVIDRVEGKVEVSPEIKSVVSVSASEHWDKNVTYSWNNNELEFVATGKAAHGSTPFSGDSALTKALRFLLSICPLDAKEYHDELVQIMQPSGVGLGIHGREDATGDLTSNIGIVTTSDGAIHLTVNVRYPTSWTGGELLKKCESHLKSLTCKATVKLDHDAKGLYYPLDSVLVKTILTAYREETGDMTEPFSMGGGTYARAIANTVSIGTGWLGDGDAHQTDERLAVESLYKMSRIYSHILYALALEAL